MFTATFSPRFYETDAFGHVNNTVVTGWLETAREPIYRLFTPDMDIEKLGTAPLFPPLAFLAYAARLSHVNRMELLVA